MNFYIVIPAHNEEKYLAECLLSLVEQTHRPKKIIIVDDASTDTTPLIISDFTEKYNFIVSIKNPSEAIHAPGSKVIKAFYKGYDMLDSEFDVICKFDADLIFPIDYIEKLNQIFLEDSEIGMAGGFCYIQKQNDWVLENLTNKDHIRGALKAYRKACFKEIGGLKNTMGWDTIDELLAQFHGWKVNTDPSLKVKHLKPTGKTYTEKARFAQGEAFFKMRYGFTLTAIATAKLAMRKNDFQFFINSIRGFLRAQGDNLDYAVSKEEGEFIRKYRWQGIKTKLRLKNSK